jgi:hypothetical protein
MEGENLVATKRPKQSGKYRCLRFLTPTPHMSSSQGPDPGIHSVIPKHSNTQGAARRFPRTKPAPTVYP